MKKFNKTGMVLILLAVMVSLSWSQSQFQQVSSIDRVGTTAAQFLKIGAGARAIGMGGAYTAHAKDILSVFYNPAGVSRIAGNGEAVFNHAEWLADIDYDFAALSINMGGFGSMALQVISFRTPEQPVRTINEPEGTGQMWDANSISLGVSYARRLTSRFSIGFTGKYIQERLFNASAIGAAIDLGFLYDTPVENLSLGASITNFGSKMRLDGRDLYVNHDPLNEEGSVEAVPAKYRTESFSLPLNLKFGLAWRALNNDNFSLLVAMDGTQPNDNAPAINSGFELGIQNMLFLRSGYKSLFQSDSEEGLTFGAGLRYDAVGTNFKFDFGWADFGRLNNVSFISFAVRY
jgi:hypothetical protein